jgi:hypothetical protein
MSAPPLARIEIRLPQELKDQLTALATERGASVSEIGVAALQNLFEQERGPEAATLEQLRRLEALLAGFVRVYFTSAPDPQMLSEGERQTAARRGAERWDQFCVLLEQEERRGTQ